jgi:DNA-binding transcriptional ArsR family regulator
VLDRGRFATDRDGAAAMLRFAARWPQRTWAIEGCNGIGRHVANRLLAGREEIVDVPPKLSARARVVATGQGRKTDATDAHSVALVGTRMAGLRPVVYNEQLAVLRVLVDRRRSLGGDHTRMISQLHQLLLELIPGGAKTALSAAQAKTLLATVRPRDAAGKARRRVAAELISDLERVYQRSNPTRPGRRRLQGHGRTTRHQGPTAPPAPIEDGCVVSLKEGLSSSSQEDLICDRMVTYSGRMSKDEDRVFKALGDPTRRFLLDLLFQGDGRTLTELESELEMTRFGVMKHLRVLEDAGLVVTRRQGREKLHFLNPVPIRLIHDRWIDKYTERQVSALADLKTKLEETG